MDNTRWKRVQSDPMLIGSDRTGLFSILYYPHRWAKKLKIPQFFNIGGIGSIWNRKLVPKAHARVQFCSDLVRSHVYFPERKPALTECLLS